MQVIIVQQEVRHLIGLLALACRRSSSSEPQGEVQGRPVLDAVVAQRSFAIQLLPGIGQDLLVGRDPPSMSVSAP